METASNKLFIDFDTANIYTQYMYSYPHKTAYRQLSDIDLIKYLNHLKDNSDLYVHLPFCETKCGFCNLFSISGCKNETIDLYIDAVCRQIEQYAPSIKNKFTSLVFGGGTPLLLSIKQIDKLLSKINQHLNFNFDTLNFVAETSPQQSELEKLKFLKENGLKRISLGIQSFIDSELKTLNRHHYSKSIFESIEAIQKYNFETVNFDLIYGIPGQSIKSLEFSVKNALQFQPDELFVYPLYNKMNTPNFKKFKVDTELQYKQYQFVTAFLKANHYTQISMRRFVRKYSISTSCGFGDTISLGCGGRSYINNLHFSAAYTTNKQKAQNIINQYINEHNFLKVENGFMLNSDEQNRRFVIKNLLHKEGIDLNEYNTLFNNDIFEKFTVFNELKKNELIKIKNNNLILTDLGLSLSDFVGTFFISENVSKLMNDFNE